MASDTMPRRMTLAETVYQIFRWPMKSMFVLPKKRM
jgi:hypothetical protein